MRFVAPIASTLLGPVRWGSFQITRWTSQRAWAHGVEVIDTIAPSADRTCLDRVTEALGLISATSPPVLRRLTRHVRTIVIGTAGPFYAPQTSACLLHHGHVERGDAERLALQLAHEATHARLWKAGFRYAEHQRASIERACIRAEMRLARRLPNATLVFQESARKLNQQWWDNDDIDERLRASFVEDGLTSGQSRFLVWLNRQIRWRAS